jgi:hypothetical protein
LAGFDCPLSLDQATKVEPPQLAATSLMKPGASRSLIVVEGKS